MNEPVNLSLEYRDDCLVIQTHGRDILERMKSTVQAVAAAIKARPVRATLLDLRTVSGSATFIDRYQMGEMAGRYFAGMRIAVLVREVHADPQRIGKLVAQNRGANVEVFTEQVIAEAWLKNTPALGSKPPTGTA